MPVRQAFVDILLLCMTHQNERDSNPEFLEDKTPQTSVAKLISLSLKKYFGKVRDDEAKYLPYFTLIKAFALMGENEKKFLLEYGMIRKIVRLYNRELAIKGYRIPVRNPTLISLLSILVRSCTTESWNGHSEPRPPNALPSLIQMEPLDQQAMFTDLKLNTPMSIFALLIGDSNGRNDDEIVEIVCYEGFGNWENSQRFLSEAYRGILNNLRQTEHNYMLQFRIMAEFLKMDDGFYEERLRKWIPKIKKLIRKAYGSVTARNRMIYVILVWVVNLGLTNPLLTQCDKVSTTLQELFLNLVSQLKQLKLEK